MNHPTDPQPESQKQPPELPRRLRRNDVSQPSAEDVRERKANLTGFFAVLREWSKNEKARPPPQRFRTTSCKLSDIGKQLIVGRVASKKTTDVKYVDRPIKNVLERNVMKNLSTNNSQNNIEPMDEQPVMVSASGEPQATVSFDPFDPDEGETVTPKPPVSKPDPTNIKSIICKPKIPITIEEMITVDLVDKPRKDHWFRVRPFDPVEATDCWPVNVFEYEHAGEMGKTQYLLDPESEAGALLLMHGKLKPALIVLGMYFHGEVFAWCVKTPAGQNRSADKWAHTRVQCAMIAQERWTNMESGPTGYSPRHAASEYDPPTWDKHDTDELLTLACKDRVIDSLDHEVIRLFTGRSES